MNPKFPKYLCLPVFVLMSLLAMAQVATTVTNAVPNLINYGGVLKDSTGRTMTSISGVTFLIYKDEQAGTPLWFEIQNVQPDDKGAYSVQLGATKPDGLPPEIFASGEARWLGVQIEGQAEQPRILLVSVPYALKAKDAETLGGHPASAYMLAPATDQPSQESTQPSASATSTSAPLYGGLNIARKNSSLPSIGGGGTAGYLPIWTDASDLGSSAFFQNSAKQVGLGTTSPVSALTISGSLAFTNAATPLLYGYSNGGNGVLLSARMLWSLSPQSPNYGIFFSPTVGSPTRMIWQTSTTSQFLSADFTNQRFGVGTATPAAALDVFANGLDTLVGNMGCNTGFTGLAFGTSKTTLNCTNYSLLGDGNFTYVNSPMSIDFREANTDSFSFQIDGGGLSDFYTTLTAYDLFTGPETALLAFDDTDYVGGGSLPVAVTGDSGCGAGFNGITYATYGFYLPDCASYSLLSQPGSDVYLNAGPASTVHIRARNEEIANATVGTFNVFGTLTKQGGSFRIDHPLDPANKFLYHSFVESPDMMNIYNGVVHLDDKGEATVQLPEWFGKLNRDFRYQLTSIGAPGPNLYIAEEVANNQFKIAGGTSGAKVSWQVTGIRQDEWANAHRIPVEEEKKGVERGHYLHPELFGQPQEASIQWAHEPNMKHAKPGSLPRKTTQPRPALRLGLLPPGPHPQTASAAPAK